MPYVGRDLVSVRKAQLGLRHRSVPGVLEPQLVLSPGAGPDAAKSRTDAAWIATSPETLSPPLGNANVLLMSTATGAADNEIFNALRIEEIRDVLSSSLALDPRSCASSTAAARRGRQRAGSARRAHRPRPAQCRRRQPLHSRGGPADLPVHSRAARQPQPAGADWPRRSGRRRHVGQPRCRFRPATLRSLHEHSGGDNVLVSGNCFGGVMARATSCGFFGARPDIIATGCQADAAEVAQSRDYLHMFFSSLDARDPGSCRCRWRWRDLVCRKPTGTPAPRAMHAMSPTRASMRSPMPSSTPTPRRSRRSLAVREIQAMAATAPAPEARALRSLLAGFSADLALPLGDPCRSGHSLETRQRAAARTGRPAGPAPAVPEGLGEAGRRTCATPVLREPLRRGVSQAMIRQRGCRRH